MNGTRLQGCDYVYSLEQMLFYFNGDKKEATQTGLILRSVPEKGVTSD